MKITNRKAGFDYTILERIEAGIALTGAEVKSIRAGHVRLEASFVRLGERGAQLINAEILPYAYSRPAGYDPKRTRQLLLHKSQLLAVRSRMESANLTVIPISLYTKGPRIKLEIALARGKKQFEKRESIKRRDQVRELEHQFRGKVK
jgi:SsrA-binding protein